MAQRKRGSFVTEFADATCAPLFSVQVHLAYSTDLPVLFDDCNRFLPYFSFTSNIISTLSLVYLLVCLLYFVYQLVMADSFDFSCQIDYSHLSILSFLPILPCKSFSLW